MRRGINIQKTAAFTENVRSRFRSRIAGGRALLLGVFLTALALSAGLVLSDSMADVSAQDGVMVHEATITVETDPRSKYFHGYSNYIGPLYGEDRVESIYGSITDATFEHDGTQYEIQRLFYNWALDTLYLKIDPLLEPSSNILPTLTIGGEKYHGRDTFLSIHHYIWWEDIAEQDWEVGDSVPFSFPSPRYRRPTMASSQMPMVCPPTLLPV